jgi:RimJ/RimL family protein N-acetyltransferase
MGYINSYKPAVQDEPRGYYGPDPYDINWTFPLHEGSLKSERMTLTPFIPSIHADELWRQIEADPAQQRWLPFDFATKDVLLATLETRLRRDPSAILFSIMTHETVARGRTATPWPDAAGAEREPKATGTMMTMAGTIALIKASPADLRAEIGWLFVFPAFQRTQVASSAAALLLRYCLELPSAANATADADADTDTLDTAAAAPACGLGLRRVQWFTHAENEASRRTALRMGFREEGTLRWERVIAEGKVGNGLAIRDGDPLGGARPSLHSVVFSLCVDDWEGVGGGRERVRQLMAP